MAVQGRQLHLSFLSVCSFQVVAALSLTDLDIFLEEPIQLPIFKTPVPFKTFFFVVPLILFPIGLYFFIHLNNLKKAWRKFDETQKLKVYSWEMIDGIARDPRDIGRSPIGQMYGSSGSSRTSSSSGSQGGSSQSSSQGVGSRGGRNRIGNPVDRGFDLLRRTLKNITAEFFLWNFLPISLLLTAFLMIRIHSEWLGWYYIIVITIAIISAIYFKWTYYNWEWNDLGGGKRFRKIVANNWFLLLLLAVNLSLTIVVGNFGVEPYQKWGFFNLDLQNENPVAEMENPRSNVLAGRDFRYGNFSNTVLDGLIMSGSDFSGAEMLGASLKHSRLEYAVFDWAKMDGVYLDSANAKGASFKFTHMKKAQFRYCHLEGVAFEQARLDGALLDSCVSLECIDLTKARLLTGAALPTNCLWLEDIPHWKNLFNTAPYEN